MVLNWNTIGLKLASGDMYTFVWVYNSVFPDCMGSSERIYL